MPEHWFPGRSRRPGAPRGSSGTQPSSWPRNRGHAKCAPPASVRAFGALESAGCFVRGTLRSAAGKPFPQKAVLPVVPTGQRGTPKAPNERDYAEDNARGPAWAESITTAPKERNNRLQPRPLLRGKFSVSLDFSSTSSKLLLTWADGVQKCRDSPPRDRPARPGGCAE